MIALAPYAGETALADPAYVGDWAAELPKLLDAPQVPPWCSYVARRDGESVGMGGFNGPPDHDGWVEIAYLTFLAAQGTGVATEVAALLCDIARQAGSAGVRAHTLPEHNASTEVLRRSGFAHASEVVDPEDGPVWRWELQLNGSKP